MATLTKRLAKLDAAKHLPAPHNNLATKYIEATLESGTETREELLTNAFGACCGDNAKRDPMGSVLANYMLGQESALESGVDTEDAVMTGNDDDDMSDSDSFDE